MFLLHYTSYYSQHRTVLFAGLFDTGPPQRRDCLVPTLRGKNGLKCIFQGHSDTLGAVHKRRPQSGGGRFVQCGQGGFFICGSLQFAVKLQIFRFEIYGVSARTREEESLSHVDKGGRS